MAPERAIQRADPRARRAAFRIVAAAAIAGTVVVVALEWRREDVQRWLLEHGSFLARHPELVAAGALALMLPLAGAAAYLWRLGTRIVRAERLPPPGVAVVRDTAVLTGRPAVARGRLLRLLAVLLGGAVIAGPTALAWIASSLRP